MEYSEPFYMRSRDTKKKFHHHEVFSAKKAGHLDTRFRRFLYHPERHNILPGGMNIYRGSPLLHFE